MTLSAGGRVKSLHPCYCRLGGKRTRTVGLFFGGGNRRLRLRRVPKQSDEICPFAEGGEIGVDLQLSEVLLSLGDRLPQQIDRPASTGLGVWYAADHGESASAGVKSISLSVTGGNNLLGHRNGPARVARLRRVVCHASQDG